MDAEIRPEVKLDIIRQGAPVVNYGYLVERGESVAAAIVDLRSKYCEILTHDEVEGVPEIDIVAPKRATNLDETKPRDGFTTVAFPEFKDWRIFMCQLTRYSLRICFVKD